MKKCPTCKGTGKMTISSQEMGKPAVKSKLDCIDCDGTGEVDQDTIDRIEFEKNMWCECEDDHGVDYYENGEHPVINKHHYRCKKCKKVVQIG